MSDLFIYFDNLSDASQIPPDSILSRTVVNTDQVKVTLFHFAAGQELSEHTASTPAIIQILAGQARLTLGGEVKEAGPGAYAYMTAGLTHAVYAHTPVVMLLEMLKKPRSEQTRGAA
ncbi:MAG: cupin domain-containing protein [Anaerolineae bacterium]|nr:cupin domain-containing protein [Anaerolineae bacterium]